MEGIVIARSGTTKQSSLLDRFAAARDDDGEKRSEEMSSFVIPEAATSCHSGSRDSGCLESIVPRHMWRNGFRAQPSGLPRNDDERMSRYNPAMKWPRWDPDLAGNIKTLLLLAIIVGGLAVALLYYPAGPWQNPNNGFGPDWECTPHPNSEPTCIKKLGR